MRREFIKESQTDYFASQAINCSKIKQALKSPAYINYKSDKSTDAMQFGKALHFRLLEPDKYDEHVKVRAAKTMNAVATQNQMAKYAENVDDYAFINPDDFKRVEDIRKAIIRTPEAVEKLVGCHPELSGYYQFNDNLTVKIRPDGINFEKLYLIDLKTATSDNFMDFSKHAVNYQYDVQAGLYLNITNMILQENQQLLDKYCGGVFREIEDFYFIVVESQYPYQVKVWQCDYEFLKVGAYEARGGIDTIIKARETGVYTDRVEDILSLPGWKAKKYKNLL